MVKNSIEKIPQVPVGLAPGALQRGSRSQAKEEDEDLGEEDTCSLEPTGIPRLSAVSRKIRLVYEHRRKRPHDDIDAAHDSPADGRLGCC